MASRGETQEVKHNAACALKQIVLRGLETRRRTAASIWGQLCQGLTRWRRRTPCPLQAGYAVSWRSPVKVHLVRRARKGFRRGRRNVGDTPRTASFLGCVEKGRSELVALAPIGTRDFIVPSNFVHCDSFVRLYLPSRSYIATFPRSVYPELPASAPAPDPIPRLTRISGHRSRADYREAAMASADVDVAPDLSNSLSDDDDFPEQLGPADDEEQATLGGADEEEVLDDDADLFGDDDDGDEKPG